MLPYSSLSFFIAIGICCAILHIFRTDLEKHISYRNFLFAITLIFLVLLPWEIMLKLVALCGFHYLIVWLGLTKWQGRHRLVCVFLMILPLILFKFNHLFYVIGLSFITFRSVQVLIDLKTPPRFLEFFSFLLFIPTLLAGPIDRFQRFQQNLETGYSNVTAIQLQLGWRMFVFGVLQKFILAELVDRYWLSHLDTHSWHWLQMLQNMVAYTLFLYFDFAGYSHMAIGIGKILGLQIPENFNHPYLAKNPREFWQRWHITLGAWLQDYVFVPTYRWLRQKRIFQTHPLLQQNIALYVTFQVMGLWNGLKLNFIIEGALFALYSIIHNGYLHQLKKSGKQPHAPTPFTRFLSATSMLLAAAFGLYIFSGRTPW